MGKKIKYNEHYYNKLPNNVMQMSFRNWTDPAFFSTENEDPNILNETTYIIEGKPYRGNTRLSNIGLALSNNESSDPGVPNLSEVAEKARESQRRSRRRSRTRSKQRKSKPKAQPTKKQNNRFGFKKAFGALTSGLKKLTGRTRRRHS